MSILSVQWHILFLWSTSIWLRNALRTAIVWGLRSGRKGRRNQQENSRFYLPHKEWVIQAPKTAITQNQKRYFVRLFLHIVHPAVHPQYFLPRSSTYLLPFNLSILTSLTKPFYCMLIQRFLLMHELKSMTCKKMNESFPFAMFARPLNRHSQFFFLLFSID